MSCLVSSVVDRSGLSWLSRIIQPVLLAACCWSVQLQAQQDPVQVDFDLAMHGVNFDLAGDDNGDPKGNGIPDSTEMALVAAILAKPALDLSASGGVSHTKVRVAYEQALQSAGEDVWLLKKLWSTAPEVVVGYSMLGTVSHQRIKTMTAGFGASLEQSYSEALALDKFLSATGDADSDGVSNVAEYAAAHAAAAKGKDVASKEVFNATRAVYLQAALDPTVRNAGTTAAVAAKKKLQVGVLLYPGFEMLDVYGPLQMWAYVPDFDVHLVAEKAGPVLSAQQFATVATHGFADAPPLDVLMVPGGMGTFQQLENAKLLDFIRNADKTTLYTTSVCTGSAILAKAGVLKGQRATTNKRFFFLSEQQSQDVEWVPQARWVESGKYFTSSGVSAGTDMALGLIAKVSGLEFAKELASSVEYEWQSDSSRDPFAPFIKRVSQQATGTAALVRQDPLADAALLKSPRYLQLLFNKAPDVAASEITLFNEQGQPQQLRGQHTMGENDLMIIIPQTLSPGLYQVKWRATFTPADTTLLQGQFSFSVGTP